MNTPGEDDETPRESKAARGDHETEQRAISRRVGIPRVSQFRNRGWILSIVVAIVTISIIVYAWWNPASLFATIAVAFIGSVLVLLLLWKVPKWQVAPYCDSLKPKARVELEIGARSTLIQIIGGVAVLASIYLTAQNLKLTQQNVTDSGNLARLTQLTERYAKAVEQMKGTDAEKVAGIYALEILASQEQSKDFHKPIIQVLAAEVRSLSQKRPSGSDVNDLSDQAPVSPAVQAILSVVGRLSHRESVLDLQGTNLCFADMHGGHFEGAILNGCSLAHANLAGAHLEGAAMEGTDLTEANLDGAHLAEADLKNASLVSTSLKGADLQGSRLLEAAIRGASFSNANLNSADFTGATGSGWFPEDLTHCFGLTSALVVLTTKSGAP
jgi:uncharacterized protein YjbI with pentapeptide repeats